MVDQQRVYREGAEDYDALVTAEDCDGSLAPALRSLTSLDNARVLEIGVGTGRITQILLREGALVTGCEPAPAMLTIARRNLEPFPLHRYELHRTSIQELQVAEESFDFAIAGWVFGHFVHWFPPKWREEIGVAVDRMLEAVVPKGVVAIIETLGTGRSEPEPPNEGLRDYYAWLERDRGFRRNVIRTDYAFPNVETAARVTGAFFGDDFAARVRKENWTRVPECTGIWWRTKT